MRCRGRGAAGDNNKSMGEEQRQRPSSAMPVAPDLEEETGIPRCSPEMAVADDDDDKSMGRSGGGASGVGSRGGDGDPRDAARRLVALRSGSSSGGTVRAGRGRGGAAAAVTLAGGEKARPTWYGGVGGEEDVVRWRRQDEDGVREEDEKSDGSGMVPILEFFSGIFLICQSCSGMDPINPISNVREI
jgi:hypothetical protein